MSTTKNGGAAFPVPPERLNAFPAGDTYWAYAHPGMTLRDYFSAAALQGLLANRWSHKGAKLTAANAYAFADAMLAERQKEATS